MAKELQPLAVAATSAVTGELLDRTGLAIRAAEVAARQCSPETRRTYAAVYRTFCTFLGPEATAEDLTAETVRAYRDQLERAGRLGRHEEDSGVRSVALRAAYTASEVASPDGNSSTSVLIGYAQAMAATRFVPSASTGTGPR
jgi:hypothetical protein